MARRCEVWKLLIARFSHRFLQIHEHMDHTEYFLSKFVIVFLRFV